MNFITTPAHAMNIILIRRSVFVLTVLIMVVTLNTQQGCSTNPATGEKHLNLISEDQEIAMGKQSDSAVVNQMGIYQDPALQRYVETLGKSLAAKSERPNLPWTFRVVDDATVNAFAIPGGFIYVTRGILTHLNNEAELAGVMGHEIGHVTAKHSVNNMATQQLTQLGVGLGEILVPQLQDYNQFISAGLGLLFLKFSRNDESQADQLGVRYMDRNGDDPRQMAGVMGMLDQLTKQSGSSIPEWQSTHPDPGNRKDAIEQQVAALHENFNTKTVNAQPYLAKVNGITFGENPRDGFFRGSTFYQPDLQFSFQFPDGWKTQNQKQSVIGASPNNDAVIQITLAPSTSPDAAAQSFFSQQGVQSTGLKSDQAHGFPLREGQFTAQTQQGAVSGLASFIGYGGKVYQVLAYTPSAAFSGYASVFDNAVHSFDKVTDPGVLSVKPQKLEIVQLDRPMTLEQFMQQYPSTVSIDELSLINQVKPGTMMEAGRQVKRVTGGQSPSQTGR